MLGFAGGGGSRSSGNSSPPLAERSTACQPIATHLPLSTPINKGLTGEPQSSYTGWELKSNLPAHIFGQPPPAVTYCDVRKEGQSLIPSTAKQEMVCCPTSPKPIHVMPSSSHPAHPTQAASGREERGKPSCCPELQAGQGEDRRNSSVSAGMSSCDLLQQIS